MTTRPMLRSLLPVLAALGLVLGACGGDASDDATSAPTMTATTATTPADEATSEPAAGGDSGEDDGSDAAAFFADLEAAMSEQQGFRFSGTFEDPTMGSTTMEGEVDGRPSTPSTRVTVSVPGQGDMETRMVDGVTYITGIPGLAETGIWLSIEPGDASNPMGGMLDSLGSVADTAEQFEDMADGASVESLGTEDVDGEQLDHYRITDEDGNVQDMWLDDDGLPRRITTGDDQTIEYHDWGAAIDIEAPDPADVSSFSDAMSEQLGGDLPTSVPTALPTDIPTELLSELPDGMGSG